MQRGSGSLFEETADVDVGGKCTASPQFAVDDVSVDRCKRSLMQTCGLKSRIASSLEARRRVAFSNLSDPARLACAKLAPFRALCTKTKKRHETADRCGKRIFLFFHECSSHRTTTSRLFSCSRLGQEVSEDKGFSRSKFHEVQQCAQLHRTHFSPQTAEGLGPRFKFLGPKRNPMSVPAGF
jgi:hypothetical protein